jgi:hypothetical protein
VPVDAEPVNVEDTERPHNPCGAVFTVYEKTAAVPLLPAESDQSAVTESLPFTPHVSPVMLPSELTVTPGIFAPPLMLVYVTGAVAPDTVKNAWFAYCVPSMT